MRRIRIGITMGDPGGIGPEIIIKFLLGRRKPSADFVVFGDASVFKFYLRLFGIDMPINIIEDVAGSLYEDKALNLIKTSDIGFCGDSVGRISSINGMAAFYSVREAILSSMRGVTDCVVTAPFSKKAIKMAGFDYAGHTEILAEMTGTRDYVMMLGSRKLKISLVTTHIPLRAVPDLISTGRVFKVIEITWEWLKRYSGLSSPRICVCGLNPHASEGGTIGDEEEKVIKPAVDEARMHGIDVEGPLPPDTAFITENRKRFDCFVCMYHDQGLGVLKALYFDKSVNITLGLPIIRTSPDHGTAFDIAGSFKASHSSMVEAIYQAYRMVKCGRRNH